MANEGGRFQPRRAIRFVFEYEGDELRLIAQQAVDMVVPDAPASSDTPGYYLDARDPGERTLARVAAPAAFANNMEVFPERHDEPIARINTPGRRSAFTVTLPSVDEADHVTMVRHTDSGEKDAAGYVLPDVDERRQVTIPEQSAQIAALSSGFCQVVQVVEGQGASDDGLDDHGVHTGRGGTHRQGLRQKGKLAGWRG